mgnify:CR=1 FL=1
MEIELPNGGLVRLPVGVGQAVIVDVVEAVEFGRPARSVAALLTGGFDEIEKLQAAPEVALVQVLTQNYLVGTLELGQGKHFRQQLKSHRCVF